MPMDPPTTTARTTKTSQPTIAFARWRALQAPARAARFLVPSIGSGTRGTRLQRCSASTLMGKRYRGENGEGDPFGPPFAVVLPLPRARRDAGGGGARLPRFGIRDRRRRAPARVVDRRPDRLAGPSAALPRQRGQRRRPCPSRRVADGGGIRRAAIRLSRLWAQQRPAQRGGHLPRRPRGPRLPARAARGGPRARVLSRRVSRRRRRAGPRARAPAHGCSSCCRRSPASASWAACTTRSSPLGSSPTPTRACVAFAGCALPLLVLHGDRDDIVPLAQGRALFEAAPGPKRMHVFPGLGHNDLVPLAGAEFAQVIASWARRLQRPSAGGCIAGRRSRLRPLPSAVHGEFE